MIAFLVDSILQFANTKTDYCVEIPAFAIPYYDLTFVLDGTMVYYANEKNTRSEKMTQCFSCRERCARGRVQKEISGM